MKVDVDGVFGMKVDGAGNVVVEEAQAQVQAQKRAVTEVLEEADDRTAKRQKLQDDLVEIEREQIQEDLHFTIWRFYNLLFSKLSQTILLQ